MNEVTLPELPWPYMFAKNGGIYTQVEEEEPEMQLAESVADASDRVGGVRGQIDRVDALLSRLRLQDGQ